MDRKIIYIANARIPTEKAHGLQIMKMCEAFGLMGLLVELILPTRINFPELKKVSPFSYYKVKENFKLKKIKCFDPNFLAKAPAGFYIFFQSFFFSLSLFFYFLFKKDKKNCVFYTRDEHLLPLIQFFSKKVVWEVHDLSNKSKFKISRHYWKIVAITNGLKNELISRGVDDDKIIVASDAVDLKDFQLIKVKQEEARAKLSLPLDKKIILYAGHLYGWKGVETLLSAASFLSGEELVVFVGGTERDKNDFSKKAANSHNILITGYRPHSEIPFYLKAADVLVLPNSAKSDISKFFTSPMKLFEYLAAGRPIIVSDLPSLREVLDENNCIFFQPDNAADLSAKIKLVLSDQALGDRLADQAYQTSQGYSWDKRAEKIISFLN